MVKRITTCLILLILMAQTLVVAARDIHVAVDGVLVEFGYTRPVEYGGHILVPVRAVFERLGFEISLAELAGREVVVLNSDDYTIRITLDEFSFTTNGVSHVLASPARRIGGSIKVPIGTVVESIGMTVTWNDVTGFMNIASPPAITATPPGFAPSLPPGVPIEFMPTAPPAGLHDHAPGQQPPGVGGITIAPPVITVPAIIHTVQPGENLSLIARHRFPELNHDDHRIHRQAYQQIVRDNPIIRNPHIIQVGWELRIYPFGTVPAPIPTPVDIARAAAALEFPHLPVEHRIAPNENLSLIAIRHFPTLNLDRDIDLRLSVIAQIARDNDIANPHLIAAGTYITIYPFIRP